MPLKPALELVNAGVSAPFLMRPPSLIHLLFAVVKRRVET
jgi:hypothetical protein